MADIDYKIIGTTRNLINGILEVFSFAEWLEFALQGIDIETGKLFEFTPDFTVEDLEAILEGSYNIVKNRSVQIKIIKGIVDKELPGSEEGFNFFSTVKTDVFSDVNELGVACESSIGEAELLSKLSLFSPKTIRAKILDHDVPAYINNALIVHMILDALSEELQGRNYYSGEPHGASIKILTALVGSRLQAGGNILGLLPNNGDKARLGSLLNYVADNFPNNPVSVGIYIEINLPKLITIRRAWSWQ